MSQSFPNSSKEWQVDFCWGDKNLVRGRESTGGIFPDQWGISPFLAGGGGGLSPPYCRENIASGIWQIGWTCSGMAENDKVLQNDQ